MVETTRLLRDLVAIPSVNPMGRPLQGPEYFEHRVTAYLEDYFRGLGVPYERQPVAPLRENIVARYAAAGAKRTLLFEVHQDTVPTDHMTIAPFGATMENGRLYGRGACDIKGGMAAMLAAFARVVQAKPATNLMLACTVDEEHTSLGVLRLVQGLQADVAVVAEPTQLNIVHAHKGITRWVLHVPGRACHSSRPEQGSNAIYRMGRVLLALERYAEQLRASRSDPLLGPPTLSVGRIDGGTSVNTVPDRCRIEIDRRLIPGEDVSSVTEDLQSFLKNDPGIDFPFDLGSPWITCPALDPHGSASLVADLGRAIDAVRGTHQVHPVPYGTDASTISRAGISAVVFGPGDIARAHTCDEWVELDEVEQAAEILFRFACGAC